ncbi:glycosyltransferase [Candidatus Pseudothioglobus singularis]|jgi:glycosyltransferase involved in cell wall biosynthesis|nr:glycosyltransferase [Candidatus Pseudothioglobus singularis]MDB4822111.1 glycosyltransferase [Candidatus Pseudothioglobus singularis]
MKVLHVITGLNPGGAELALFRLVNQIQIENSASQKIITLSRIKPHSLHNEFENIGIQILSPQSGFFSLISYIYQSYKLMKDTDVIQSWMYHADFFVSLFSPFVNKKIFWNIRNSTLEKNSSSASTRFARKILAKISFFVPYKIVTCSLNSANHHIKVGYDKSKFIHIPNGYNNPNVILQKKNDKSRLVRYGCAARWHPQKGHDLLFNAMSKIKNMGYSFELHLAGTGISKDNAELSTLLKKYDLEENTTLYGYLKDMSILYKNLDYHVLPSISGEAFPNVVAESMFFGVPNICSDIGDTAIIIANTGYIFELGNRLSLINIIKETILIYENKSQYNAMSKNTYIHAMKNFSINKMSKRYLKLWK